MYDDLVEFLQESVTPFHAAATAESWLCAAGFTRLEEADYWNLEPGKGYYTTRNGSSVVAWRVPQHAIGGWRIGARHSDSPSWKIKADTVENDGCRRLSVEGYGGMIMSTWLDRPLTVGGRALVKTEDGIESRLVCIDRDLLVIPSLAIHFQRDINKGHTFNPQVDMQPLWGPAGSRTLTDLVAESLGVEAADILDSDLQLVTRQAPTQIGPDGEFFMAPRIDDLECAATTLLGFLDASGETDSACAPVWAMFDNEEVGSSSRMGAESSFLRDVLDRILEAVPHSAQASHRAMANSFMLSADNAHATHPNFPQKSDPCAPVRLGGGVVLLAFTKLYGTVFLGSPRSHEVAEASEVGNVRIAAMAIPLAGILFVGLFPRAATGIAVRSADFFIHTPADAASWLLSPSLTTVGRTAWLLLLVVALLVWLRSRILRTRKVAQGPTWGCGFTSVNVRMQYTGESFSEGLQSIATPLTQNSGEGSPVGKGEIFPASHSFDVGHRDRIGRLFSMWWVELLRRINARVMRLRTGKINHYVLFALAFLALIFILSILNLL